MYKKRRLLIVLAILSFTVMACLCGGPNVNTPARIMPKANVAPGTYQGEIWADQGDIVVTTFTTGGGSYTIYDGNTPTLNGSLVAQSNGIYTWSDTTGSGTLKTVPTPSGFMGLWSSPDMNGKWVTWNGTLQ